MRSWILICAAMCVAACGGSDDSQTTPAADSATTDTATTDTASDSRVDDSATSDTQPADAMPMSCTDAGALPTAASGKSVINATLTPDATYNGNKTAFAGVETSGTASTGGGFTNFMSSVNTGTASQRRELSVIFPKEVLAACVSYAMVATGPATGTDTVVVNYVEGLSSSRWRCKGTVIVDSVMGKSIGYHINATSCDPMPSPPANSAEGSFALTGVGSSTTLP
jgi:hypothetical protein